MPIVFGVLLCIQPADLFAKTICFAGGDGANGAYLFLSGGKTDEKPFAGNLVIGSFTIPTWGVLIQDASGNIQISFCGPHSPSGTSSSFCGSLSGPTTLSLSGQFDNKSDGSFDGSMTLTEVNCSSIPPASPEKAPVPGSLGFPEKSEE